MTIAKEASPPAPVAQEKPLITEPFRCGNAFGDHHPGCPAYGPCEYEAGYRRKYGHPPLEPIAPEHRRKRGSSHLELAKEADRRLFMQAGAPAEDPKPPEAEEPAIVQRMRQRYRVNTLDADDTRQLLAFIDSRKAAVSDRIVSTMAVADALGWDKDSWNDVTVLGGVRSARQEADMMRRRATAAEQERDRLREELSALKARPVVDVGKPLRELADYFRALEHRETTALANAWSHAREMCEAAIQDLSKGQPASAKADEKCTRCGGRRHVKIDDPHATSPSTTLCPECRGSGSKHPSLAMEADRRIFMQSGAPESPTPEQVAVAEKMHGAEPSRVGEEEQERRLYLAEQVCRERPGSVEATLLLVELLVEYLRAEREGRKAT